MPLTDDERIIDLLNAMSDVVIVHDADGRVLHANRPAQECTGRDRDALLAGTVDDLCVNGSALLEIAVARRPAVLDVQVRHPDGALVTLDCHCSPIRWRGRDAALVLGLKPRVRLDEMRLTPPTGFHPTGQPTSDVFWIDSIDMSQQIYVSGSFEEIWGRPAADLEFYPDVLAKSIHPDDREEMVARVKQKFAAREAYSCEYRINRPDGELRYIHERGFPVRNTSGDSGVFIGISTDITEQKRQENVLLEMNRASATLFANLPGMAYRCRNDENWTMEFLSEACEEYTGYPPEAFLDNTQLAYADLIHPEDRQRVWLDIQTAMAHRESFEIEYRVLTARDGERWFWERGRGVFDGQNRLEAIEGFISDITKRKRLETQSLQSRKLEAIGQLAGGIAPDFNNPLQVINGYAAMLVEDLDQGTATPDQATEILRAGQRAESLVRQLLAFSRRQILEPRAVDINALAEKLVGMLTRMLGEHIELRLDTSSAVGPVHADPVQIEQVLINLCINARDAMPDGGKLEIATRDIRLTTGNIGDFPGATPGRHVQISVSDTGCGMDETTLEQSFEPFFTTKDIGKGTGLGLATIYGIIQQHGGAVRVESAPGEGAAFHVVLPVADTPAEQAASSAPEAVIGGTETILVAEDDDTVLQFTRRILEKAGYIVLVARDGLETMTVFEQHREDVDLALLDVVMPGTGGRAAHDHLRTLTPDLPVLFCTGYSPGAIHQGFVIDDGLCYIQKPFERATLLRRIRAMLDERVPRS